MSQLTVRLQTACRRVLSPIAAVVRRALTPPTPPVEFIWQRIDDGPAAGTEALLPGGSELAAAITTGQYEPRVLSVVQALVGDSDICFDIGGHYGYYTLSLANLAPHGQVHTFEPVAAHANRIQQAVDRARFGHVTVHEKAVAGRVGEMTMHVAEAQGADDSMAYLEGDGGVDTPASREHYDKFTRTTIQTTTLDQLAGELPLPRFIKIDAEGAEGPILASGLELIQQARPRLLVELHGIHEAIHCAAVLDRAGYQAILLHDQKTTLPILWTPRDDHDAVERVRSVLQRDPVVLFGSESDD